MNLVFKMILIVVFGFFAYFIWQATDAVVIDNQYHFSHEDINKLYEVETQLGDILGTSVIHSKDDVLYNLVISAIQKSILDKNGIKVQAEEATRFVEQNNQNFKGFYQNFKQQLGDDDYYHLLIEPVAISRVFLRFYNAVEPAQKKSNLALEAAKKYGLSAVASNLKQKIVDVNFIKNNSILMKEFLKFKKSGISNVVYPSAIKINDNIAIFELNFKGSKLSVKALVFKIVPYQNFLAQLAEKIMIKFPTFSRYSLKDIHSKDKGILQ